MYSNIHTSIGTIILISISSVTESTLGFTGSIFLGASFSAFSHYIVDYLLESNYKRRKDLDIIFHVVFLTIGFFTGYFWWFFGGMILGNLFDIVDKKGGLYAIDIKKYPITYYFHRKSGKGIKLTSKQTRNITYINFSIVLLYVILETIF